MHADVIDRVHHTASSATLNRLRFGDREDAEDDIDDMGYNGEQQSHSSSEPYASDETDDENEDDRSMLDANEDNPKEDVEPEVEDCEKDREKAVTFKEEEVEEWTPPPDGEEEYTSEEGNEQEEVHSDGADARELSGNGAGDNEDEEQKERTEKEESQCQNSGTENGSDHDDPHEHRGHVGNTAPT